MYTILWNVLRPVLIWAVQRGAELGIWLIIEKGIDVLIDWVKGTSGITQEESESYVSNVVVDIIGTGVVGSILIYKKIPVTLIRKLGLSGGKPTKRAISAQATAKIEALTPSIVTNTFFKKAAILFGIYKAIEGLVWLVNVPIQAVEPGIYQAKQANDIWESIIGKRPFSEPSPLESPGPFKTSEFEDYARSLEATGIQGFEAPYGSFIYSRTELAKLVDYIYGAELAKGKTLTSKTIVPILAPYLIISAGKTPTKPTTSGSTTATTPLSVPKVQVFSGVLSQGVLGKGLEFQARPDDMIETAQEMLDAASNNLAPWLGTLPSRVTYQVRVVSSVTTKDGFTQKGSVVQVISGYNTNGTPKYKTVVNKFAVLDLYVLNDKGSRIKLQTIVLGPVDSVKFQVGNGTIQAIETAIQKVVATTDIGSIKGVETTAPVTITTPQSQIVQTQVNTNQLTPQPPVVGDMAIETVYAYIGDKAVVFNPRLNMWGVRMPVGNVYWPGKAQAYQYAGIAEVPSNPEPAPAPAPAVGTVVAPPTVPAPVVVPPAAPKPGANAQTLFEWYSANSQAMPTLQQRSVIYENFGLGKAIYYTGTAEQNTKLLLKLKG